MKQSHLNDTREHSLYWQCVVMTVTGTQSVSFTLRVCIVYVRVACATCIYSHQKVQGVVEAAVCVCVCVCACEGITCVNKALEGIHNS